MALKAFWSQNYMYIYWTKTKKREKENGGNGNSEKGSEKSDNFLQEKNINKAAQIFHFFHDTTHY